MFERQLAWFLPFLSFNSGAVVLLALIAYQLSVLGQSHFLCGKMEDKAGELRKYVKEYPGFPKDGINFLYVVVYLGSHAFYYSIRKPDNSLYVASQGYVSNLSRRCAVRTFD